MDESSRPDAGRRTSLLSAFVGLTSSHLVRTVAGFVFWVLVARLAPTPAVGVAGAVIAAVGLLSRFTSLGLGTFLMAELPRLADDGARELFRLATAVLVVATVPVALAYTLVVQLVVDAESSAHAAADSLALAGLFLATMVLTAVTSVWDYGALGLGHSSAQVVRNLVASLGRFPILLAWPLVGEVGAEAIMVAWVAPIAVSALVFMVQVRLGEGRGARPRRSRELLGRHWRTSLGHYFLDVALSLGPLLVPVVAAAVLVPRENGFFTVAWMAATVVFVAPYALATSLFASSAADGSEAYLRRCRRILPTGLALVTGGVLGTWLAGPTVFRVFGEEYVDAALPLMTILVLGGYWMVVKDLLLDQMRLDRRFPTATAVAATATALDVAGALVGGLVTDDGTGVAAGWVISSAVQVVLFSPVLVPFVGRIVRSEPLPRAARRTS